MVEKGRSLYKDEQQVAEKKSHLNPFRLQNLERFEEPGHDRTAILVPAHPVHVPGDLQVASASVQGHSLADQKQCLLGLTLSRVFQTN